MFSLGVRAVERTAFRAATLRDNSALVCQQLERVAQSRLRQVQPLLVQYLIPRFSVMRIFYKLVSLTRVMQACSNGTKFNPSSMMEWSVYPSVALTG